LGIPSTGRRGFRDTALRTVGESLSKEHNHRIHRIHSAFMRLWKFVEWCWGGSSLIGQKGGRMSLDDSDLSLPLPELRADGSTGCATLNVVLGRAA